MDYDNNVRNFDPDGQIYRTIENGMVELKKFHHRFPFRIEPDAIDSLTRDDIYAPGISKDYFFYWLEFKLGVLGRISVGSDVPYRSAADNIDLFKSLLKKAVNSSLTLAQKIDANWQDLKGFGGEKVIAKKILSLYLPEDVIPVFKTSILREFHANLVGVGKLPRDFESCSMGEKYEVLTESLLRKKNEHETTREWNNFYFMRFLYEYYKTPTAEASQLQVPIEIVQRLGLNHTPRSEMDVLFLFIKLHRKLGYKTIVKLQREFPDVQAIDENDDTVRIELELNASNFRTHGHDPRKCDVVICWDDDVGESWDPYWPPVKSLRQTLLELSEAGEIP
ncbi:MAG: hypothetical protein ACTSVT_10380 [Candidatus Thorarchaeota archaeon]